MSEFVTAIEAFIDAVMSDQAWVEELNDHSHKVASHYDRAKPAEVGTALGRLAELLPDVRLVALGHVAITCGSLVERGGDPASAGPALLEQLPRVNETTSDFYQRCRTLAEADAGLIEELRAAAASAGDDVDVRALTAAALVNDHLASDGWQPLAQRFGPVLYRKQPASVLGHMADEFFRLGLIAHLSRSKGLRQAARARPELLAQTLQSDAAAGLHRSFLAMLLQVLDDEPLLVVHVEQRKGFEVRIGGIADNFQLHTVLAGAIIGWSARRWLTGARAEQAGVGRVP
jgi:hypothetical protein